MVVLRWVKYEWWRREPAPHEEDSAVPTHRQQHDSVSPRHERASAKIKQTLYCRLHHTNKETREHQRGRALELTMSRVMVKQLVNVHRPGCNYAEPMMVWIDLSIDARTPAPDAQPSIAAPAHTAMPVGSVMMVRSRKANTWC